MYLSTEPNVREQPSAARTNPHNDAANVDATTEPRDATDDVQPTG